MPLYPQPVSGTQSVPLYRLPLMISAQRKFSFGGAMLEFSVTLSDGQPGARPDGRGALVVTLSWAAKLLSLAVWNSV
eukprot:364478-Chlamydomonas_euryale.AAC.13